LGLSAIPLYLLAGLAFGEGGLLPLVTAQEFIEVGAEIGVIPGQTGPTPRPAIRDERRIVAHTPADRGPVDAMSIPAALRRSNGASGE
jgi:hypothetical protein